MVRRLIFALIAAVFALPAFASSENSGRFDQALSKTAPTKAAPVCWYYNDFMLKAFTPAAGADRMTVLSYDEDEKPSCKDIEVEGEKILSHRSDEGILPFKGFVAGVKDRFIVLVGAGTDAIGRKPFAVFDRYTGWEHFEDAFDDSPRTEAAHLAYAADFRDIQADDDAFSMTYKRVYAVPCSPIDKNAAQCWERIKQETQLTDADKPDCIGALWARVREDAGKRLLTRDEAVRRYQGAFLGDARYAFYLRYDATLAFDNEGASVMPLPGKAECAVGPAVGSAGEGLGFDAPLGLARAPSGGHQCTSRFNSNFKQTIWYDNKTTLRVEPEDCVIPSGAGEKTCFAYPAFMIRQVSGEPVAASSLLPLVDGGMPDCAAEISGGAPLTGPLLGVKGNFVFTGWSLGNGGSAFAVYSASTGKRLFADMYRSSEQDCFGQTSFIGELKDVKASETTISLRYKRRIKTDCSLVGPSKDACWAKVKRLTGLMDASRPDCGAQARYRVEACGRALNLPAAKVGYSPAAASQPRSGFYVDYDVAAIADDAGRYAIRPLPGPTWCAPVR